MKVCIIAFALLALLPATSFAQGTKADAIVGFWYTKNHHTQFDIYKCGKDYCGKISYLRHPDYPLSDKNGLAGQPKRDRHNPDPRLRKRTLLGLPLLSGFRYRGHDLWAGGKIYDPNDGGKYSCKIWLAGNNRLKLRGYIGFSLFGETETWVRGKQKIPPRPGR